MAYMHTLPGFKKMEKSFNKAGYKLEVDLSNTLIIEQTDNLGEWIDYDQLPKELQTLLDGFAAKHKLDN